MTNETSNEVAKIVPAEADPENNITKVKEITSSSR